LKVEKAIIVAIVVVIVLTGVKFSSGLRSLFQKYDNYS